MKKVTVIEYYDSKKNKTLGFTPIFRFKGQKPQLLLKNGEPLMFKTEKEAKAYGLEYIKPKN